MWQWEKGEAIAYSILCIADSAEKKAFEKKRKENKT